MSLKVIILVAVQVENFQPFYIFNKRFMNDMKIGNAIIKEFLGLEDTKTEHQERARREEKAARDAAKDKVCQPHLCQASSYHPLLSR